MSSHFDSLTRENIEKYVVSTFGHPKKRDAVVKLIDFEGRKAIFKDLRPASRVFKYLFGRRLMKNEFKTYEALNGIPGIPKPYKMIDEEGILIEYIDCPVCRRKFLKAGKKLHPEVFDNCIRLVESIHARGILHFDLRNRKNFLLADDGAAHIIDFASAMQLPAWLPLRKTIFRWLSVFDKSGIMKLKRSLAPERLTEYERKWLKRYDLIRTIIFPPGIIIRWFTMLHRKDHKQKKLLAARKAEAEKAK